MKRPSPFWRGVLRFVLPARDRETLLDEMDRLFQSRFESDGPSAATGWYRSEVLQFARRWPGEWMGTRTERVGVELGDVMRVTHRTMRRLLRTPGFATVATLTLGLGIGATAVIVGIADRAILRALPYPEPGQLVAVMDGWGTSLGAIEVLQGHMTQVDRLGGAQNAVGMTLESEGSPARRLSVASVSPEYLEALGVTPIVGRTFRPEEARPGRGRVVLLGSAFWRSHFGGTPNVVGRSLVLDGESHLVVGVLPPGFDLPTSRNDVWRPVVMDADNPGLHWGAGNHTVIARMAPGATPELVRQELLRVQDRVAAANPLWTPAPGAWDDARVTPLRDARAGQVRTPLLVLLGAVAIVLMVVCANVASLFLSRSLARRRDHAVRSALGAGPGRLAREQMLEVTMVAAAGLAVGLGVAQLALAALRPHLPIDLPGAAGLGLDLRVALITAGVALLTAAAAGVLPSLRTVKDAPAGCLRESGRGGGVSPARRRTTRLLVGAQLAAAVVLVTSAGLLARTLLELSRVHPGFEAAGRVTAQVHVPPGLPADLNARAAYFGDLEAALQSHPSLQRVAFASTIPFGAEDEYVATLIDGVTDDPNDLPVVRHHRISPAFFEVTGIPLRHGRAFSESDRLGSPLVAIIDQTFVDEFLAGEDAIGRIIRYPWRGAPPMEVVGVVGATFHGALTSDAEPTVWVPLAQMGMGALGHVVAVGGAAGGVDTGLRAITERAREVDDRLAVSDLAAYSDLLTASMADTRLVTLLLLIFAGTTLVLGCVGVYGVAAFSVRERIGEIGVRMALGAKIEGIRRRVLLDGLRLTLPGGLLGMLLAVPAAGAMEGVLYGVAPTDMMAFTVAPAVLAVSVVFAVYVPARRATQVDPAIVLRGD